MTRKDPDYLRDIVECAILTGMRKGEILSLRWDQIRDGFIYLRETKTNEPRQIPINETLALNIGLCVHLPWKEHKGC
jgi:integrase